MAASVYVGMKPKPSPHSVRSTLALLLATVLTFGGLLAAGALATGALAAGHDDAAGHKHKEKAEVEIQDFAYHPHKLHVAKGTKVVFANHDSTTHTATSRGAFNTGNLAPGESARFRLKKKGTYRYHCKIHSFMHGKIVVG